MSVDMTVLKKEVKRGRKKATSPVPNTPVLVIAKGGTEVARINPNSLNEFVREHGLDFRACESILNRTYVNHEGYTFKVELPQAEGVPNE